MSPLDVLHLTISLVVYKEKLPMQRMGFLYKVKQQWFGQNLSWYAVSTAFDELNRVIVH